MIIVPLPYETPPLSLNKTMNRHERARVVSGVRTAAFYLAKSMKLPRNVSHMTIQLHYAPKAHRVADPINLTPTQKACVDGLVADYGMTPGDDPRYVTDKMPFIHPQSTTGKGQLWLQIEVTE